MLREFYTFEYVRGKGRGVNGHIFKIIFAKNIGFLGGFFALSPSFHLPGLGQNDRSRSPFILRINPS